MTMLGEVARGVHDGLRGAAYLARHPRLWWWVIAPAIVIAVLFALAIGAVVGLSSGPLAAAIPFGFAHDVIEVVEAIVLAIASASVFVAAAALIAGPFNEMLSEAIEEHETGVPSPRFSPLRFLGDLALGLTHSARRIAVYLVTMGALLLVGLLVPVAGTALAAIGGAWATARFAAYDAYDSIWGRSRWRYRAKIAYLKQHGARTLGLGAVVAVILLVPGLNLVALSIGAAGATLRWLDQHKPDTKLSPGPAKLGT